MKEINRNISLVNSLKTFSENDGVYSSEEEKIRPKIVKIQKNNLSAQNQPQGNNPSANKSNQLDEIFNLTKTSNNTNNNNSSK